MRDSVAGIIKKNGMFLLGKRKAGGSIGGKWEFPGGKVKAGEDLALSLKREFLEELGVNIIVKNYIIKKDFYSDDHNFTLHAYYIELCDEDIKKNEHDEFKFFSKDEIYNLRNKFADSDKILLEYL